MKNQYETLQNLKALLKASMVTLRQDAAKTDDFIDLEAIRKAVEDLNIEVGNQFKAATNELLDASIEMAGAKGIEMSIGKVREQVRERIKTWKS